MIYHKYGLSPCGLSGRYRLKFVYVLGSSANRAKRQFQGADWSPQNTRGPAAQVCINAQLLMQFVINPNQNCVKDKNGLGVCIKSINKNYPFPDTMMNFFNHTYKSIKVCCAIWNYPEVIPLHHVKRNWSEHDHLYSLNNSKKPTQETHTLRW